MPRTLTADEYLLRVREKVDALKARNRNPGKFNSQGTHAEICIYFANRAIQIGEGCFRIYDLQVPLLILARVLCEDLIRLFWASQSTENAAEFEKLSASEMTRALRANLLSGRARIRHGSSGEDVTKSSLPELEGLIAKKKTIENMAKESGLSKLYDVVYRVGSLVAHGNMIGLESEDPNAMPVLAALSAINGFLGVITMILDGPTPKAKAILDILGIGKIGGS